MANFLTQETAARAASSDRRLWVALRGSGGRGWMSGGPPVGPPPSAAFGALANHEKLFVDGGASPMSRSQAPPISCLSSHGCCSLSIWCSPHRVLVEHSAARNLYS